MKSAARYHHGDLRRALIDASAELVAERGARGLSFREVARRLGVSHAAPLHHFADKRALTSAVAAVGFDLLCAAMERARALAGEEPLARLEATGVAYVRFAVEQAELFRLMFGPELCRESGELGAAEARAFGVLLSEASAVLEATSELDPERLRLVTTAAWSLVHGLAVLSIDRRFPESTPEATEALARDVTRLVARSLGR